MNSIHLAHQILNYPSKHCWPNAIIKWFLSYCTHHPICLRSGFQLPHKMLNHCNYFPDHPLPSPWDSTAHSISEYEQCILDSPAHVHNQCPTGNAVRDINILLSVRIFSSSLCACFEYRTRWGEHWHLYGNLSPSLHPICTLVQHSLPLWSHCACLGCHKASS